MVKLKRKAFRMVGLLFPLTYYVFRGYGFPVTVSILALFITIMVFLEYYRFRFPGVNRWLFRHFKDYTKEKERGKISTTTLYLVSCLLTILLFERSIAIAAMVFLAFGDPLAEIVGTRFGRIRFLGKSLEGSLACFLACWLSGSVLLLLPGMDLTGRLVLIGALAATFMEFLPVPVDDNFTVPLFSASVMHLAWLFL